jgi:hypothetical protein
MQTPWRFTTWLDLLDHWQSLVAGVLAFIAAVIVVVGAEWFARRRDRREVAAIRASLAVEVQQFTDTLLRVRGMIQVVGGPKFTRRDLLTFTEFHPPDCRQDRTVGAVAGEGRGRLLRGCRAREICGEDRSRELHGADIVHREADRSHLPGELAAIGSAGGR